MAQATCFHSTCSTLSTHVIRDLVDSARETDSDTIRKELDSTIDDVWSTPAKTWDDIVARAEIARFWVGDADPEYADDLGDRAVAELVKAVLAVARND